MPAVEGRSPGYQIQSQNPLRTTYPGDLGSKTGFTDAARHTFVTAAERNGRRLVVSIMDTENRPLPPPEQAVQLLDWGFARAGRHARRGHAGRAGARSAPRRRRPPPRAAPRATRRRPRVPPPAPPPGFPVAPGGAGRCRAAGRAAAAAAAPSVGAASPHAGEPVRRPPARRRPGYGTASTRPEGRRPRRREEGEAGDQVDPHQQAHRPAEGRRRDAVGDQRQVVATEQLQDLEARPRRTAPRAAGGAAGRRPTAPRAAATGRSRRPPPRPGRGRRSR